jgi:hypothetical protein
MLRENVQYEGRTIKDFYVITEAFLKFALVTGRQFIVKDHNSHQSLQAPTNHPPYRLPRRLQDQPAEAIGWRMTGHTRCGSKQLQLCKRVQGLRVRFDRSAAKGSFAQVAYRGRQITDRRVLLVT